MKKIEKLGIFDSGLGGYTVFQDLKKTYPDLSMVLYADQKNAPYGNHSPEEIIEFSKEAMNWFKSHGINDVLLACNTVSSVAYDTLIDEYPEMRIWGIIELTLSQINEDINKLGLVGTQATVNTHAYRDIYLKTTGKTLYEVAIPELATAIEDLASIETIESILNNSLDELKDCSHIILGCTHFPLVKESFEKTLKINGVFDSLLPIRELIGKNYSASIGTQKVITTSDPIYMRKQIKRLYNEEEKVEGI